MALPWCARPDRTRSSRPRDGFVWLADLPTHSPAGGGRWLYRPPPAGALSAAPRRPGRRDRSAFARQAGEDRCERSPQLPTAYQAVASWLLVLTGHTPRGLPYGHQTRVDEDRIAGGLASERMRHESARHAVCRAMPATPCGPSRPWHGQCARPPHSCTSPAGAAVNRACPRRPADGRSRSQTRSASHRSRSCRWP